MADTLISPPEPTPSESPETGNDHDYELPAQKSSIGSISQKLLLDVLIPAGLLMGGIAVLLLLGTAQTEKKPRIGTDYRSRMEALSEVRVQRLQTLASLGEQLQLVVDGSVVPFREAKVAAEVAGKIESKTDNCEAGAYVEANELLMTIDPTDYELEVEQLTQLKNQESQSLREVDQEKDNTGRSIKIAKQDLELQQKEVDRQNQLRNGFTSPAEIDKAQRALLAATQQLVSFENQLSLLRERRLRFEAAEQLAESQLKRAKEDLKRTQIRAPISGVIVSENVDLHSFVTRGTTLVTIDDTSKAEVATSLRMDQLYWVLNQQLDGNSDQPKSNSSRYKLPETQAIIEYELSGHDSVKYYWKAKLMSYDGIGMNAETRTVPVRVVVDNPDQHVSANGEPRTVNGATALVRGMYVRVKLLINPKPEWIVIPAKGMQVDNRILQFIPDPSVLTQVGAIGDKITTESAAKQEPASQQDENFDPAAWVAGKVSFARGINPIAPLSGSTRITESSVDGTNDTLNNSGQRLWVCEVERGSESPLDENSFVVVSPFQDIGEDSTSTARAPVNTIKTEPRSGKEKRQAGKPKSAELGAS